MQRYYYSSTISGYLDADPYFIMGRLVQSHEFPTEQTQRDAWLEEIYLLKQALTGHIGSIYFEYSIPRMGKRIDVVCIIGPVIFVLEFKIGMTSFNTDAMDQVMDYALDLKNFHETSHDQYIAPVLISSRAENSPRIVAANHYSDRLYLPIRCNADELTQVIADVLLFTEGMDINSNDWENGRYSPTPTIIEAAIALYRGHSVKDISRSDASAINLSKTSDTLSEIIKFTRDNSHKSICFVTGVPGSGKTLVGLNIATTHMDNENELYSVFLSGNGPLVAILREALTRNKVKTEKEQGNILKKGSVMSEVKTFIQNVHHFRDECLIDNQNPPHEHVVLFDEAQRAWDLEQTANFMRRKKNIPGFNFSEPEFLISCLDRHEDWAVIICLVGGGQEINTGEAGINEWIRALQRSSTDWQIYISPHLTDSEYGAQDVLNKIAYQKKVNYRDELHLSVSMRSFRAENVSLFVKQVLDLDPTTARRTLALVQEKYPIMLTRNLQLAKKWLKDQARGSERLWYRCFIASRTIKAICH